MLKIIVTRQVNGKFQDCGMNDRTIFSHYKTLSNALRYGAKRFANGKPCRVEVYPSGNIYAPCNWVLYFDAGFKRV